MGSRLGGLEFLYRSEAAVFTVATIVECQSLVTLLL